MAYDPDVPPSLVGQAIGGPEGLRWFALMWTDPIATVLTPGYISNAEELGMRAGDGLIYKDTNRGEWDHYDLIVAAINSDGSADVAFPEVPEEALPLVTDPLDPSDDAQAVVYLGGRQVRVPIDQAAAAILTGNGVLGLEATLTFGGSVPATLRSMVEREVWADYSFGADGTEAGDIAGVQAAIDYVGTQGGGTVRFLAREYLGGGWDWPNGVRLIGSGYRRSAGAEPKGTVIQRTVAEPCFTAQGTSLVDGGPMDDALQMEAMLIHGGELGPTLVSIRAATHVRLKEIFLKNTGVGEALVLHDVFDSRLYDCAFETSGTADGVTPVLSLKNTAPTSDLTNQIHMISCRFETFPGTAIKTVGNNNNELYFDMVKVESQESLGPLVDIQNATAVHFGLLQIASCGIGHGGTDIAKALHIKNVSALSGTVHMEHFGVAAGAADVETYAILDAVSAADISILIYGATVPTSGKLIDVINSTDTRNDIRVLSNIAGLAPVRTLTRRGSVLISSIDAAPAAVFKREDIAGESWSVGSVVADGSGSRFRFLHNSTVVGQFADDGRIAWSGQFIIDGTWEKPLVMGGKYLWVDPATDKLYIRSGLPTSVTDGTVVGPPS